MDIKEKDGTVFVLYESKQYRVACMLDCIDKAVTIMENHKGYVLIDQMGDYAVVGYESDEGVLNI